MAAALEKPVTELLNAIEKIKDLSLNSEIHGETLVQINEICNSVEINFDIKKYE